MRNGWLAAASEQLEQVRHASESFLGKFAADCLISRDDALDRIARDLQAIGSWRSSGGGGGSQASD